MFVHKDVNDTFKPYRTIENKPSIAHLPATCPTYSTCRNPALRCCYAMMDRTREIAWLGDLSIYNNIIDGSGNKKVSKVFCVLM